MLYYDRIKPLYINLPEMSGHTKRFDETKCIWGKIWNAKKYNEIWDKVNNSIEKGFASEPV